MYIVYICNIYIYIHTYQSSYRHLSHRPCSPKAMATSAITCDISIVRIIIIIIIIIIMIIVMCTIIISSRNTNIITNINTNIITNIITTIIISISIIIIVMMIMMICITTYCYSGKSRGVVATGAERKSWNGRYWRAMLKRNKLPAGIRRNRFPLCAPVDFHRRKPEPLVAYLHKPTRFVVSAILEHVTLRPPKPRAINCQHL